jgi:hypothetical protein
MFISDPRDTLEVVHSRGRDLRRERAAEGFRRGARRGASLAALLRRAADRLDPTPVAHRPA